MNTSKIRNKSIPAVVINADIWKIWKGRKYIHANLFPRDGFTSNDENDFRPQFLIGW